MERLLLVLILAGLLTVGCGGGKREVVPTPTDEPAGGSPSPAATASAAPATPTATPEPRLFPAFPAGTRTGIDSVDSVIRVVEAGDTGGLLSLVTLSKVPCGVTGEDLRPPPDCPEGIAHATPVEVLPVGDCEGWFRWPDSLKPAFERYLSARPGLYGVAVAPAAPNANDPGTFRIVFASAEPRLSAIVLTIRAGRIIATEDGCGWQPPDLLFSSRGGDAVFGPPPWAIVGNEKRTGLAKVDAVIEALASGEAGRVLQTVGFTALECTTGTRQLGSPPACPVGVADGTQLDVFIFAVGCDFDFAAPAQAHLPLRRAMGTLKALVAVHERPWPYPGWLLPEVRYEVLFERFDGFAISFHLDADGRVRFVADRCGATPARVIGEAGVPNLLGSER